MIYIETNSTDVFENFAIEYYFAKEKTLPETVFLFWRTTPTLMVGKYQNVAEEINLPYAKEHGITISRRFSGGGTIYTDMGGWQFSFIEHKNAREIEFHEYIASVIDALKSLGVEAAFNGRNDLTIDGKKFSGNAQYRLCDSVVHHGSLLFSTDIEQMVASTTVDDYKIISKSIKSVRDRVTNISDHLCQSVSPEQFKSVMVKNIMHSSDKTYVLTDEDKKRIKTIRETELAAWDYIYGKNPKFNIERTGRFAGGKIQFKLDIKKGLIESAAVFGDFFSTLSEKEICDTLIGCRYDRQSVLERLKGGGIEGKIYNISVEEIAALISD